MDWITTISPEWISAISTLIYMVFTGVMMGLTFLMILESRKARKLQEEPQIDAFIQRGEDCNSKLYLVIKNNGRGGAYDVKLSLKEDFDTFAQSKFEEFKKLSYQGPFKNGISFLPPSATREMALGIFMGDEFNKLIKKTINLELIHKQFHTCESR